MKNYTYHGVGKTSTLVSVSMTEYIFVISCGFWSCDTGRVTAAAAAITYKARPELGCWARNNSLNMILHKLHVIQEFQTSLQLFFLCQPRKSQYSMKETLEGKYFLISLIFKRHHHQGIKLEQSYELGFTISSRVLIWTADCQLDVVGGLKALDWAWADFTMSSGLGVSKTKAERCW